MAAVSPREHVDHLARQIGATVFYDVEENDAYAETRLREVHLAKWRDGENPTYWSALHELGHVATQPPQKSIFADILGDPVITHWEAVAWQWALDHALAPPDEAARTSIAASLGTYLVIHGLPLDTSVVDAVIRHVGIPDWSFTPDFILESNVGHEAISTWEERARVVLG